MLAQAKPIAIIGMTITLAAPQCKPAVGVIDQKLHQSVNVCYTQTQVHRVVIENHCD